MPPEVSGPQSLVLQVASSMSSGVSGIAPLPTSNPLETRRFGERLNLPQQLIADLVTAVEQVERKIARHRSPQARITLTAAPGDLSLEWSVSSMRITEEDSRAVYIGPLPASANRGLPLPVGREPAIVGSGWWWLYRGGPQAILLERPHPREVLSGDVTLVDRQGHKLRLAVVDGLGHGPQAREAAQRAVNSLRADSKLELAEAVLRAHDQLGSTRGATLGLVDIDFSTRIIKGTTVGNVRVVLFFNNRVWSPCGTDAVLGHGRGGSHGKLEVRIEQHPYPEGAMLALFSDGLLNQLRLPWQRGDLEETAAQLFHTFSVATDDATLLLLG